MTPTLTAPAVPPTAPPAPTACAVVIAGESGAVRIPPGLTDLDSFVRWCHSDEFPEHGRITFLAGVLRVDLTMEQAFSHNGVKTEVAAILAVLARTSSRGRYFGDGMRWRNTAANVDTIPDGLFYLFSSRQSGTIQDVAGKQGGVVEFVGTPDMVLEVVSDSSAEDDNTTMPALYQAAGVPEFWRIDARGDLRFEILRLTPTGYGPTQLADGWWRSDVFAHDFSLTTQADPLGQPQFILEFR